MLSIGSTYSANSAQFAYTISCAEDSDAVSASVSIGRIRRIQLVAASYPVDARKCYDGVINGKSEVPGNAEYLGYTEVPKPGKNVLDYGGCCYFSCWD